MEHYMQNIRGLKVKPKIDIFGINFSSCISKYKTQRVVFQRTTHLKSYRKAAKDAINNFPILLNEVNHISIYPATSYLIPVVNRNHK